MIFISTSYLKIKIYNYYKILSIYKINIIYVKIKGNQALFFGDRIYKILLKEALTKEANFYQF